MTDKPKALDNTLELDTATEEDEQVASTVVKAILAEASNPGIGVVRAYLNGSPVIALTLIRVIDSETVLVPLAVVCNDEFTEMLDPGSNYEVLHTDQETTVEVIKTDVQDVSPEHSLLSDIFGPPDPHEEEKDD